MKTPTVKSGRPPWANAAQSAPSPEGAEPMTKRQAAAFIVDQLKPSASEHRRVSGIVGQRLSYALQEGHLRLDGQKKIPFDDLIVWCNTKSDWGTNFVRFSAVNKAIANTTMDSFATNGLLHALPTNHDAAVAALAASLFEHHKLKVERDAMDAELSRLRPLLVASDERSQKARAAGKKGGRPRKS